MTSCYCSGPLPGHTLCPCQERALGGNATEGWKCPQCGKIHAPFVMSCNCISIKNSGCLWDGMPEISPGSGTKIGWLSCPCPKCSPRC